MNETPPPGVSWHVYVDRRLEDFKVWLDERFRGQQAAVLAFDASTQRALEKVNEFRASITDRDARFASIDALKGVEARVDGNVARLGELEQARVKLEGYASEIATIYARLASKASRLAELEKARVKLEGQMPEITHLQGRADGLAARIHDLETSRSKLEGQAQEISNNTRAMLTRVGIGLVLIQIALSIVFKLVWR